jgi:hypothetical protein
MKTPDLSEEMPSAPNKRNSTPLRGTPQEVLPVVPAQWPRSRTRADEALQALLTGPQNQYDFRSGGWRLAANVQKLEDLGWRFFTREIMRPGCRKTIKEYRVDRTDPGTAAALLAGGLPL